MPLARDRGVPESVAISITGGSTPGHSIQPWYSICVERSANRQHVLRVLLSLFRDLKQMVRSRRRYQLIWLFVCSQVV